MKNSEIKQLTREKISAALKQLSAEMMLSQITVSKVINTCNINRNTFYYHFSNVNDLLIWTLTHDINELAREIDFHASPTTIVDYLIGYIDSNRKLLIDAYSYIGYEKFRNIFFPNVYKFITILSGYADIQLSMLSMETAISLYTEALYGKLIHYMFSPYNIGINDIMLFLPN